MARWLLILALLFIPALSGCGNNELGPAEEAQTPEADQEAIKKQMEESKKKAMEMMKKQ